MLRFSIALLVALLCACGGGSGLAPAPDPALLSGTYRMISLAGLGGVETRATTKRVQSDGVSSLTFSSDRSAQEGTVLLGISGGSHTYGISPDRTLTLDGAVGRITANGMLAAASVHDPAATPAFHILVRELAAPTIANLAGEWLSLLFFRSSAMGGGQGASFAQQTIEADGSGSLTNIVQNADGSISNPGFFAVHSYGVSASGSVTRSNSGGGEMEGGISEDGTVILLAGDFGDGYAQLQILVRRLPATLAQSSVSYDLSGWQSHASLPAPLWGGWTYDGSWFALHTSVVGGVVEETLNSALIWNPADENQITAIAPLSAGPMFRGAVSPAGEFIVMAGGFVHDDLPTLGVLIR